MLTERIRQRDLLDCGGLELVSRVTKIAGTALFLYDFLTNSLLSFYGAPILMEPGCFPAADVGAGSPQG